MTQGTGAVRQVCLIGPGQFLQGAAAQFAAAHPELAVTHIDYVEPAELRRARAREAVTPALQALAPPLDEAGRHALAEAEAVIALDFPAHFAAGAPRLRYLQAFGAGTEWLVPLRLHDRGVVFADASGVSSGSIAEFVLARLLQVWKDLPRIDAQQADATWQPRWASEVDGRVLGLVSLGAIGRAVAVRARAFGMTVLATRRRAEPGDTDIDVDELFALDRLDEMLARCDAVVLAAPATPATADLFDAGRFAAMRRGAIFCNVSRGSLVDEDALLAALRSGQVGTAVLDVVKDEPAPPDHPFWREPNVLLSPHCSASFDRYTDRLFALFVDNLRRLADGRALRNAVDPEHGY